MYSSILESLLIPNFDLVTEAVDTASGSFMNTLKNEIISELKKANTKFVYNPPYKFNIYMDRKLNSYVLEFRYTYLTKSQMEYFGIKSNGDTSRNFPKILRSLLTKYPTLKYKKSTSKLNSFVIYTIYSENKGFVKEDNSLTPEFTPENMDTCANKIMSNLRTIISNTKRKYPKFEWGNPSYSFNRGASRNEESIVISVVNLAKDYDIPGTSKIINEIIKDLKQTINKYYSNKSKVKLYYDSEDDSITITLSYKS